MHDVRSEAALLTCFREIDQPDVLLAPDFAFPLQFESAFAWTVGPRAYLLFRDRPDRPTRGIVFHRSGGIREDVVAMCDWCHRMRGQGNVRLMSARAGERRRVGLYLCSDLSCVAQAAELVNDPAELYRRIGEFASRRLF